MSTGKKMAVTTLFTLLLLCQSFFLYPPKKVEAGLLDSIIGGVGTIVQDPWNLVKTTVSAAYDSITSASTGALAMKETVLDPLAYAIAKKLLQQMVYSIVDWINSGFKGSPAFITDYKQFFLDAADKAAGDFLQNELGFLCAPFQFDIKAVLTIQLMEQRDFRQRSTCTLSGAADNVQDFVGGNFSNGGWSRWFEITTVPANNFIGALGMGQAELAKTQADAKESAQADAQAGHGLQSAKICFKDSSGREYCRITTPGVAIADQLTRALGASEDTLISADEINEVVSALFSQLAVQAVTGVNGLLGLSYQGSNGQPSYLSQYQNDINTPIPGIAPDTFITDALATEQKFKDMHVKVQLSATTIMTRASSTNCGVAATIETQASKIADDMNTSIAHADANIQALTQLQTIYNQAQPDVKVAIAKQFQTMISSGQVPNAADLALRQIDLNTIQQSLDGYSSTLNSCGV